MRLDGWRWSTGRRRRRCYTTRSPRSRSSGMMPSGLWWRRVYSWRSRRHFCGRLSLRAREGCCGSCCRVRTGVIWRGRRNRRLRGMRTTGRGDGLRAAYGMKWFSFRANAREGLEGVSRSAILAGYRGGLFGGGFARGEDLLPLVGDGEGVRCAVTLAAGVVGFLELFESGLAGDFDLH